MMFSRDMGRRTSRIATVVAGLALIVGLAMAHAPTPAQAQTRLLTNSRDWSAYKHEGQPAKICFALSKPKSTKPRNVKRGQPLFYVSSWPNEGVKAEVSVTLGYPAAPNTPVKVQVGNDTFQLSAKDERAFVNDATQELKLIEAMRKGATMVVEAKSKRGTLTKDTYSLRGVTAAIKAMTSRCD